MKRQSDRLRTTNRSSRKEPLPTFPCSKYARIDRRPKPRGVSSTSSGSPRTLGEELWLSLALSQPLWVLRNSMVVPPRAEVHSPSGSMSMVWRGDQLKIYESWIDIGLKIVIWSNSENRNDANTAENWYMRIDCDRNFRKIENTSPLCSILQVSGMAHLTL